MWLIYTRAVNDTLEKVVKTAAPPAGEVDAESRIFLNEFISRFQSAPHQVDKDSVNNRTVINGAGDVLVYKIELEHQ
jgi:hypothetical protein